MPAQTRNDLFHGLFRWHSPGTGPARVVAHDEAPRSVPDPESGRPLKIANLEVTERAICPACAAHGAGGFVSFVADLRLAYACPSCRTLVWLSGS